MHSCVVCVTYLNNKEEKSIVWPSQSPSGSQHQAGPRPNTQEPGGPAADPGEQEEQGCGDRAQRPPVVLRPTGAVCRLTPSR